MRWPALLAACAHAPVAAESPPVEVVHAPPSDLLAQVRAKYAAMESYRDTGVLTRSDDTHAPISLSVRRGGEVRYTEGHMDFWSDRTTAIVNAGSESFADALATVNPATPLFDLFVRGEDIFALVAGDVRERTLEDGTPCWRIETKRVELWIDQRTLLLRQARRRDDLTTVTLDPAPFEAVTRPAGPVTPLERTRWLSVALAPGTNRVAFVYHPSLTNLRVGDELVALDGIPYGPDALAHAPWDGLATLELVRDGQRIALPVQIRPAPHEAWRAVQALSSERSPVQPAVAFGGATLLTTCASCGGIEQAPLIYVRDPDGLLLGVPYVLIDQRGYVRAAGELRAIRAYYVELGREPEDEPD